MVTRISTTTAEKCAAAWPEILPRLRDGELVTKVAAAYELTRSELWAYRNASPELRAEWADAMVDSSDALCETALETASNTDIDPKRARVLCDLLMLVAEKRNPERYAQRSRHDINVKTLDLGPILARAEARLAAQRVIEGEVLRPALGAVQQSADPELDIANSLF
jgi:hypothetical protein